MGGFLKGKSLNPPNGGQGGKKAGYKDFFHIKKEAIEPPFLF
jgi:hypothetical protein